VARQTFRSDVGGQMLLLRLSKLGESILNDPQQSLQDHLTISNWVLDVLNLNDTEICNAFELAHSIYTEGANDEALEIFRNVRRLWDFPQGFLYWWIEAHVAHDFNNDWQEHRDLLGCRIIDDKNGQYHYLP